MLLLSHLWKSCKAQYCNRPNSLFREPRIMLKYELLGPSPLTEKVDMSAELSNGISGEVESKVQAADLVVHYGSHNAYLVEVCVR